MAKPWVGAPGKRSVTVWAACWLDGLLALADSSPDQMQKVAGELSLDGGFHGQGLRTCRLGEGVVPWRWELW